MISEKKVWWYDGLWLAGMCPVRVAHLNTTITSIFILEQAVLARITDEWRHQCLMSQPRTPISHPGATLNYFTPAIAARAVSLNLFFVLFHFGLRVLVIVYLFLFIFWTWNKLIPNRFPWVNQFLVFYSNTTSCCLWKQRCLFIGVSFIREVRTSYTTLRGGNRNERTSRAPTLRVLISALIWRKNASVLRRGIINLYQK